MNEEKIIHSWHERADAYDTLLNHYPIFSDMATTLIHFVKQHRSIEDKDLKVMDLAAGTGLVSKLLIEYLHLSPSSLYLIEPAKRMYHQTQLKLPLCHIYQSSAEDCLSLIDLPRNEFDFILCNASMHLMSEERVYPIINRLLKSHIGFFLYTLWYHSLNEIKDYHNDDEFQGYVNDALISYHYPKYYSSSSDDNQLNRSKQSIEEAATRFGLELYSCEIYKDEISMNFNLDFVLMSSQWLMNHLETHRSDQTEDVSMIKAKIVEKIRQLIDGKTIKIAYARIILCKRVDL